MDELELHLNNRIDISMQHSTRALSDMSRIFEET